MLGKYSLTRCTFSNSIAGNNDKCDTVPVIGTITLVGDSSLFFEGDTFTLSYLDNDKMRFWANNCSYTGYGQPTCFIDFICLIPFLL